MPARATDFSRKKSYGHKKTNHNWTYDDDILALCAYYRPAEKAAIAADIGVPLSTLEMRLANIKACDTGSGLGNVAQNTQRAYAEFKGKMPELEQRVAQIRASRKK